ncbi:MAG: DUF2256 domain-containing protein [Opitutaceae bacterium]
MKFRGKTVHKSNLPTKVCIVCQRPFTWRKRWENCWDEVVHCSERCRRTKRMKGLPAV